MNLSAPFIKRPIATSLLAVGLAIAGIVAFNLLPVSPLPQVDFPTISVQASLPGASARRHGDICRNTVGNTIGTYRWRYRNDFRQQSWFNAYYFTV